MNRDKFLAAIDNPLLTFDERLDVVKTCAYDIREESQPWCLLQYFSGVTKSRTSVEHAFQVAEAFKDRFGLLIIERESSYCGNELMTIMDEFENEIEYGSESEDEHSSNPTISWVALLQHAFIETGFLYARDVSQRVLYAMYLDKYYHGFSDTPFIEMIEPSPITEDLIKYLFHPDRLGKWMEANPDKDIEEYLH